MTAVELTPENFAAVEAVAQQARSDADAALNFMLGYVNGAGPWLEKLADYLDDVGHPGGRRLRRITEVAADTATKAEEGLGSRRRGPRAGSHDQPHRGRNRVMKLPRRPAHSTRPDEVVQTVQERRHILASLVLVALLTVVIFAVAAAADLGSWFVS